MHIEQSLRVRAVRTTATEHAACPGTGEPSPVPGNAPFVDRAARPCRAAPDGGVEAELRILDASDADAVVAFFAQLSARSLYLRFHHPVRGLGPSLIRTLCGMNGDTHIAVGAFNGETLIGIGRYVTSDADASVAEVAFTVADGYQGQGIGTRLLQTLAVIARKKEVKTFTFSVLTEDTPALRLLTGTETSLTTSMGQRHGRIQVADLVARHDRSLWDDSDAAGSPSSDLPVLAQA